MEQPTAIRGPADARVADGRRRRGRDMGRHGETAHLLRLRQHTGPVSGRHDRHDRRGLHGVRRTGADLLRCELYPHPTFRSGETRGPAELRGHPSAVSRDRPPRWRGHYRRGPASRDPDADPLGCGRPAAVGGGRDPNESRSCATPVDRYPQVAGLTPAAYSHTRLRCPCRRNRHPNDQTGRKHHRGRRSHRRYGLPKACRLMWGTVLALALWIAADPTRLVIVAVLMSRLRPKHNLLAYWLGGLAAGVVPGIGVFALALAVHDSLTPAMDHARSTAARFTGGYFQIAVGVVALLIAALVSARRPARRQAGVLTSDGLPSGWGVQSIGPTAIARVWARVGRALQRGNPWVAFGVGLVSTMPPIDYLLV